MRADSRLHVNSEANESEGGFPTLPLRQSEAALLHHRHSQYAPRAQQQKIVASPKTEKGNWRRSQAKSTSVRVSNGTTTANMADNEKLDNQRLKNFKNKGRDLEVKVPQIRVEEPLFSSAPPLCSRLASPPGFLVTSFLISTVGNFVLSASARGLLGSPI